MRALLKNRNHPLIKMLKSEIEISFHLIFWLFILSALNVDWTANWFDSSLRPNTPAPLSVIAFALFFYVNTFLLLPKYFSISRWKKYFAYAIVLFILPELIRVVIYGWTISNLSFESELFSRDSLLFASPSPFFISINASFIYRLTKDRLLTRKQIQQRGESVQKKVSEPYKDANLLTDHEARKLERKLNELLADKEIFLNPKLTLRDVAEALDCTEKKVSYLLNQYLESNFYEYINKYRADKFKAEIAKTANKNLSMVGIALNCGFSSKSSFYRVFKLHMDMSPAEYLKRISR